MGRAPHPRAVITGASSGIGFELAKQFASHGFDLVIAAEETAIQQAAGELSNGVAVQPVEVDLTTSEGVAELVRRVDPQERTVDALALNAGVGAGGAFIEQSPEEALRIVDLNVRSTVELARLMIPPMVARGRGRVLFTSSIASTMPGPFQAVYNASKSFVQSFALALRNELKGTGVTVTTLMPGATDTRFFERAHMLDTRIGAGHKDDPELVAREGFEALMAGRERVIAGSVMNKLQGQAGRVLPDPMKAAMHRFMAMPGSAKS